MGKPGSQGELLLQKKFGTETRARAFYKAQMRESLNSTMQSFIKKQSMMWVATSDAHGHADCTFRTGPEGFVNVIDKHRVAWPEYRGNGVMASIGNMSENANAGLLFIDFFSTTIGLHVNGRVRVFEKSELMTEASLSNEQWSLLFSVGKNLAERWIIVEVEEAYIHCAKHIPLLAKLEKNIDWGTDDVVKKGGDAFRTKSEPSPWNWDTEAQAPIKKVPLLQSLNDVELKAVLALGSSRSFGTQETLIREGELVSSFLIIQSGSADVHKKNHHVATVGVGDFVGEISLISRMSAVATVTARSPVEVLAISTAQFRALLRELPSLADKVLEAMAARLN